MSLRTLIVAAALLSACAPVDEGAPDNVVLDDLNADGKADSTATKIWYTPITKEYFLPSEKIATETRKLFKSEAEWQAFFGAPSPGIDFSHQWAIFYTPGSERADLKTTPGWQAKLARVSLSATGATLSITTRLEMNGATCAARRTVPFITATIEQPASQPPYKRFYKSDTTRSCP